MDMAEGSAGTIQNRLIGCFSAARRCRYLDLKARLSNKFWALFASLPVSSRRYGHEDDFEMNK
jgi:hypothetical protein